VPEFFDPQYDKPLLIPILWLVFDIRHVLEITFLGRSPVNLADQQTCIAWKNLAKSAHLDAILDNCDDEGFPIAMFDSQRAFVDYLLGFRAC
jgi:hypothetical protein